MNTKRLTCCNDTDSYLYGLTFRLVTINTNSKSNEPIHIQISYSN